MEANTSSESRESNCMNDPKFAKFKADLLQTSNVLELMKSKADDLKSWTELQWGQFLDIVEKRLSAEELAQFVEWIMLSVKKTSFGVHCLALIFVLRSIDHLLFESQESKQPVVRKTNVNTFISFALRIISESEISLMKSFTKEEYASLEKAMELLPTIAIRKPPSVSIKITLELWKSFSTIFMIYYKRSRAQDVWNTNNVQRLLEKPVNYLIQEVGRNIELIYKAEALKQPVEQVDKYLRVTNFYLKIIRNFMSALRHKNFDAASQFFECFKISKFRPKHLCGTEIANFLDKYVSNELDDLLSYVYQNPQIFKLLFEFSQSQSISQTYVLFEAYLETIISDNDSHFITMNIRELKEIFAACFRDETLRWTSNFYDTIVAQFSALAMLDEKSNLLNYFRENIFKDNYWMAAASTEVLVLIQRHLHKRFDLYNDILLQEYYFWRECYAKFSLFSSDLKQTHICKLLSNCSELVNINVATVNLSAENYRFLLANNDWQISEIQVGSFCKTLHLLLNQLNGLNGTVHIYYKAIILMQFLESFQAVLDDETFKILEEITERLLNHEMDKTRDFSLFLNYSLKIIGKFAQQNPSYNIETFLNCVKNIENLTSIPGSIKLLHYCNGNYSPTTKYQASKMLKQSGIESFESSSFKSIAKVIEFIQFGNLNYNCCERHSSAEPQRYSYEKLEAVVAMIDQFLKNVRINDRTLLD